MSGRGQSTNRRLLTCPWCHARTTKSGHPGGRVLVACKRIRFLEDELRKAMGELADRDDKAASVEPAA